MYIPDHVGYVYCLDAKTGQCLWVHNCSGNVWGSPLWADGRIYVATANSEIVILQHGRTARTLATIDMEETIRATPSASNGVLYVASKSKLYAISIDARGK